MWFAFFEKFPSHYKYKEYDFSSFKDEFRSTIHSYEAETRTLKKTFQEKRGDNWDFTKLENFDISEKKIRIVIANSSIIFIVLSFKSQNEKKKKNFKAFFSFYISKILHFLFRLNFFMFALWKWWF